MRKFLYVTLLLSFSLSSFAQTKEETTSALNDFCKKIVYNNPIGFEINTFADLAYLKRNFPLPYLKLDDSAYIAHLNDYYYKRYFPYSKLFREDAVVTEDCLHDEVNDGLNKANKVLFYVIYPNSIKLPADIADQFEEYSTVDEFFGPYLMLNDIYFLKKYNYNNLNQAQKDKLAGTEAFLSKMLYTKYVDGKPWAFYRFLSLQVLRMNGYAPAMSVDINDLVKYFNANGALELGGEDIKNMDLLKKVGGKKMMQYEMVAVLWIFLTELKKN